MTDVAGGGLVPALFEKDGFVSVAPAPIYRKSPDGLGCIVLLELCASEDRAPSDPRALFTAPVGAPLEVRCQLGAYFQVRFKDAGSVPPPYFGAEMGRRRRCGPSSGTSR